MNVKGANTLDNVALLSILTGKTPAKLDQSDRIKKKLLNATEVELEGRFDNALDFVDLHLDFPVVFGEYTPGYTPFLQAAMRSGAECATFHKDRLDLINSQYKKYPDVAELIRKYSKGFYGPFCDFSKSKFKITVKSRRMEDINSALYTVISQYVMPFTLPNDSREIVDIFSETIIDLVCNNKSAMGAFMQEIFDTGFLASLQNDCLKVYKPIFDAELPLRPALFLDLDSTYSSERTAMHVSSQDFEEYREVYKDMIEVLNRQLVLLAGIGNLIERGDHNIFAPRRAKSGKILSPNSLNQYADTSLGNKLLDLDCDWYSIDPHAHDSELRNAIAHNKVDYDEVTQVITYYPKLEGMERERKKEIQLLDYMHRLLILFREVHRLHHLVKCLNYATLLEPGASLLKRS